MFLLKRQSDAEFISRTRQLVQFWDRWRHFVTIGGLALFCWAFWYMYATWQAVLPIDENAPLFFDKLNKVWMLISLLIGLMLGMNFAGVLSYMVKSILGGYRAERLLLKLHAELNPPSQK